MSKMKRYQSLKEFREDLDLQDKAENKGRRKEEPDAKNAFDKSSLADPVVGSLDPLNTAIFCPVDGTFLRFGLRDRELMGKGSPTPLFYCIKCKRFYFHTSKLSYGTLVKGVNATLKNICYQEYRKINGVWTNPDTGITSAKGRAVGVSQFIQEQIKQRTGKTIIDADEEQPERCPRCKTEITGPNKNRDIIVALVGGKRKRIPCSLCESCNAILLTETIKRRLKTFPYTADCVENIFLKRISETVDTGYEKEEKEKKSNDQTVESQAETQAAPNNRTILKQRMEAARSENAAPPSNEIQVRQTTRNPQPRLELNCPKTVLKYNNISFDCYYIGEYLAAHKGEQNAFSKMLLEFKSGKSKAMKELKARLELIIPDGSIVCVVPPSHQRRVGALSIVIKWLSEESNIVHERFLTRVTDKSSYHLDNARRDPVNEYRTIACAPRAEIEGKRIILMDDVCTSGSTMYACRQLLLKSGAEMVTCLAIGRTV